MSGALDAIPTFTGRRFSLLAPRPADVDIRDIAHGLALCNRWAGQSRWPISVAQHSVLLVGYLQRIGQSDAVQRHGLLHDAAEAYCHDLTRPAKAQVGVLYASLEARIAGAIVERFELAMPTPPVVTAADAAILTDEQAAAVSAPGALWPDWRLPPALGVEVRDGSNWRAWERAFLAEFDRLWPDRCRCGGPRTFPPCRCPAVPDRLQRASGMRGPVPCNE